MQRVGDDKRSVTPMDALMVAEVHTEVLADSSNPQLLVHVTSEDGLVGVGETWWGTYQPKAEPGTPVLPIAAMIDAVLAPLCLGRDSTDISGIWHHLERQTSQYGAEGIVSTAISGIDVALWDLLGKRRGVPTWQLLGSLQHERLQAYASLHWLGDVDAACRDATGAVAAGFRAVKLHEADAEIVLGVRDALGPDITLMVDMSGRVDEQGALVFADRVAGANLAWIEEPIYPYDDHAALARIRERIAQPVAAGENVFSVAAFERLLRSGAIDVLQPDLVKCGGLTPAAAIADLADEHGAVLCPHNFSLGPSLSANIAWAFTSKASARVEVPWLSPGHEFPANTPMPVLVDGYLSPPIVPGLST